MFNGIEIYNLRYVQLNLLNSNINILKKDHNFKFNLELKIKDDFFTEDISFEKYTLITESISMTKSLEVQKLVLINLIL